VNRRHPSEPVRYIVASVSVAVVVYGYRGLHIHNPTTVALTLLLTVLVISAFWGLRVSVFTAVIATLGFNYYFLPPVGTFAIADPQISEHAPTARWISGVHP
jgi:two-component system sensor histidine kinase KdpD